MKLLTPQQSQGIKAGEDTRLILRIQELRDLELKERLNLAKVESEAKDNLAKHLADWTKEEEEHLKTKKALEEEIATLEEKRAVLLVPVSVLEDQAKAKNEEADKRIAGVKEKEFEAQRTLDLLEDKLEAVGEREQNLVAREKTLFSKQEGLKLSIEQLSADREAFNKILADFSAESAKKTQELQDRETKVVLRERSAQANEDRLIKKEKDLDVLKIRLEDQRATLEREEQRRYSPPEK